MIQTHMERIAVTNKDEMEVATNRAKDVLEEGGIVIYPTDTLYGVGADATNEEAIEKVLRLKGRDFKKPLSVMVSNIEMATKFVHLSELAKKLFHKILPGPFTLILPKQKNESDLLTGGKDTLGVRVPDSFFCVSLSNKFGKPITATSANLSGKENGKNVDEILDQFGAKQEQIDIVIDTGEVSNTTPSTVLKVEGDSVEVLREGSINHTAMLNVTKEE